MQMKDAGNANGASAEYAKIEPISRDIEALLTALEQKTK